MVSYRRKGFGVVIPGKLTQLVERKKRKKQAWQSLKGQGRPVFAWGKIKEKRQKQGGTDHTDLCIGGK